MTHDSKSENFFDRKGSFEQALIYEQFSETMEGLNAILQFSKAISPQAWLLYWASFPPHAKQHVTPAMWAYAACQRLMDPAPTKELALHFQLLRYLYRLENGMPNFDWGLKEDLAQRMERFDVFNPEPRSLADLIAAEGVPALDGSRHEPNGLVSSIQLFS